MSDTLDALQKALKPKTGLRPIPFPTESYQHASKPFNAKRLLNYVAEDAPPDSRAPFVLVPTPGLVPVRQIGSGPWFAFNTNLLGGFYVVSDNELYRSQNGVLAFVDFVGFIVSPFPPNLPQMMVTIAVSPRHAVICVPPRLYYCSHTSGITEIDTSGFPGGGAQSVTYIDGYFVATQYGAGTAFRISGLNDPSAWDALDFANVEGMENVLLRAVRHRGELWLLGVNSAEVWYDAGAADFPFRRQAGGVVPYGFVSRSVASIDGSLWWVSRDNTVFRSTGYQATRVSTYAIETIIESANPDLCFGNAYMQNGHAYYCVTLPDINRTLCYDAATKRWADRSSSADGSGPWRPLQVGRIGENVYAGDAAGWMYLLDPAGATDNGVPILRQVTLPPLYADGQRAFCARAEIEMEVGGSPGPGDVTLDWSDDGGNNFRGGPRVMSGGTITELRKRVYTTRLGSFRERVFRVTTRGRTTLYGVGADVTSPASLSGANS
jgi:hypothetical protein